MERDDTRVLIGGLDMLAAYSFHLFICQKFQKPFEVIRSGSKIMEGMTLDLTNPPVLRDIILGRRNVIMSCSTPRET